jgi:rhodanese-related sulfurtransferase
MMNITINPTFFNIPGRGSTLASPALFYILVLLLCLFQSAPLFGSEEGQELERYRNPEVVAEMIDSGAQEFLLLDVRSPGEYQRGHIPTAVNVPIRVLEMNPPRVPEDRLIIAYCRSGNRSARATQILTELGYTRVVDFGGLDRWDGELK